MDGTGSLTLSWQVRSAGTPWRGGAEGTSEESLGLQICLVTGSKRQGLSSVLLSSHQDWTCAVVT
jgi:hypothetical protein